MKIFSLEVLLDELFLSYTPIGKFVFHALFHQLEAPVEGLHDLHNGVAQQDDGEGLDNEGPATGAHILHGALQGGQLVLRQLNDEIGLLGGVGGDLLHQQGPQQDDGNTREIH